MLENSSCTLKCTVELAINQIYLSIVNTVYNFINCSYEIVYALLLCNKETVFILVCSGGPQ